MIQYLIGLVVGTGTGIAIGLYIARGRKFSELTPSDRKRSTTFISIGLVLLAAGIGVLIKMVTS